MNFTLRFGGPRIHFGDHDFESILTNSLKRFSHRLKQIYVFLDDFNGPRGGVDKQCRCVLHLRRMPPIVIQDQDEDTHALVHRVANRAAYVLSQKTERRSWRAQRFGNSGQQRAAFSAPDSR